MKYVDAGYVICLSVLSAYAFGLVRRRRRLLRAVAAAGGDVASGGGAHAAEDAPGARAEGR